MTNTFLFAWLFLIGLCFGSFVNVVALRDQKRWSIVTGRSFCPHCKHVLAWYDLIPLLSYLILGGKCRYCKKIISVRYLLVELLAAFFILFAYVQGVERQGSWLIAGVLFVTYLLFLIFSLVDAVSMEVPLEYVIAAGTVGGVGLIIAGVHTLPQVVLGIIVGAGSIAFILYGWKLLFKQDGMGVGDIWIAGAAGAVVGYPLIIIALLSAVMVGAVAGILLIVGNKKSLSQAIPFGPFIFAGLIIATVWGQQLLQWYIL